VFYVTGFGTDPLLARANPAGEQEVGADLKWSELVANIYAGLRWNRLLQRRYGQLTQFFSRTVVTSLESGDAEETLKPRQTEITALFCDLRGFSMMVEKGQEDLLATWDRLQNGLEPMVNAIVGCDGVVGDFQGDAAMGFFGWPLTTPREEFVEKAARAALEIWRSFDRGQKRRGSQLEGMACGIGVATGEGVVGQLGTVEQFKVGAFGPVVNLASRLESLTKRFGVPILVDDNTAGVLNASSFRSLCRLRRIGKVRPAGMSVAHTIWELLPPRGPTSMSEEHRIAYEAAVTEFEAGHWNEVRRLLRILSADGPARFLTQFMEGHKDVPPPGWDGVIVMTSK
jgi:adenylate cyclase